TMLNFEISNDLTVKGALRRQHTGHYALNYRERYQNVVTDDIIKSIESTSGIELSELEIQNMKNPYEPLTETYKIDVQNQVESIGDKLYFSPLLFLTEKENPFKSEDRKYPVDFSFPRESRYMINI